MKFKAELITAFESIVSVCSAVCFREFTTKLWSGDQAKGLIKIRYLRQLKPLWISGINSEQRLHFLRPWLVDLAKSK